MQARQRDKRARHKLGAQGPKRFFFIGALRSAVYGAEITGIPPRMLRTLNASAGRAVGIMACEGAADHLLGVPDGPEDIDSRTHHYRRRAWA